MKKRFWLKRLLIIALLTSTLLCFDKGQIQAASPYVTQTINRYGELVPAPDAYEAIMKLKKFPNTSGAIDTLNNPKDIFIDRDNYLYIADTRNRRVVILNDRHEYVNSFGDSDNRLISPRGVYVRDDLVYVADYGSLEDNQSGRIYIYQFNKNDNLITFKEERACPDSPLLKVENFNYRPEKIAVDNNKTMYVVVEGSFNGILMINDANRFMSFFSPNQVSTTLKTKIIKFLYGDNEEAIISKTLPPPPFNVVIDDSGYIYTVTQTIVRNNLGDTLKKVNIGGINYFPVEMYATSDFVSAATGKVGNVFAVTKNGFIYEYDKEGNLLFIFSGKSVGTDQLGLFNSASAIAVNSQGYLYVTDDNDNSIQIFKPTQFVNLVHQALGYYNNGQYLESKSLFEEVLRYNSMFDFAHKGIGMAHYQAHEYEQALEKFEIANAKEEYSDAYWEIRNEFLTVHAGGIMAGLVVLVAIWYVVKLLNKKTQVFAFVGNTVSKVKQVPWVQQFSLMFRFIKKPLDTGYLIKTNKKISFLNGIVYIILIFALYLWGLVGTGFLFNDVIIERTILLKEAFKIVIPIVAFVVANYLTSSLLEGEGTFRGIFLTTMASLTPIIVIYPFLIIISNFLTYNESFIYYFGITIMLVWSAVLLFIANKELHNYSVKRNIFNFLVTFLLMVVLIIACILVYMIIAQVVSFVSDIVKEVIFRD
jgi:tetratricopeptide (TPR) repeat protein